MTDGLKLVLRTLQRFLTVETIAACPIQYAGFLRGELVIAGKARRDSLQPECMMRVISSFFMLIFFAPVVFADSIYSGEFDYSKAHSYKAYFLNKTDSEIAIYCKRDSMSTEDLWQCSHFYFEKSDESLTRLVSEISRKLQNNDMDLKANGEPPALPYFEAAQQHWKAFRDNECYSDTYSLGQASMRYMVFWDCMTRITKDRFNELTRPDADE
ncbi:lysozyme inhibitor LprI family protein [Paraburkholderia sp. HP33-1]|uniref:lysozyme inhibitor LprI family protein n=1 Tax=Paraburkholderia sp. HP33-1 TaxID=2883243 RepID=UPI001F3F1DB2|nr:lysozyme inhibitor LprI family protein [Paraburkholderia sp. HP33-1]